jgi:hypothetical protein
MAYPKRRKALILLLQYYFMLFLNDIILDIKKIRPIDGFNYKPTSKKIVLSCKYFTLRITHIYLSTNVI